jgi:hypothetical protein
MLPRKLPVESGFCHPDIGINTFRTPTQRLESADRFFAGTGADIRHGGTRPYYVEGADFVQMPQFEMFTAPDLPRHPLKFVKPSGKFRIRIVP